jgi:hypothetical protein
MERSFAEKKEVLTNKLEMPLQSKKMIYYKLKHVYAYKHEVYKTET